LFKIGAKIQLIFFICKKKTGKAQMTAKNRDTRDTKATANTCLYARMRQAYKTRSV
jgi:hypothetical protein